MQAEEEVFVEQHNYISIKRIEYNELHLLVIVPHEATNVLKSNVFSNSVGLVHRSDVKRSTGWKIKPFKAHF